MAAPDISRLRVLIVDDVRAVRTLMRSLLSSFGITDVLEAADGLSALEVLGGRARDLVITDLLMKPMNGVEFVRNLRQKHNALNPYIPVLMVSGHADVQKVKDAIAAGVNEFLTKPVSAAALKAKLMAIVERPGNEVDSKNYCGPSRRRAVAKVTTDQRKTITVLI